MGKINLLQPNVANKIAAGEVVERPASVVKELVENAIDAGATAVTIEIQNSGADYIRVTDNGMGMAEEDCVIAFERHATSKIFEAEDLTHIDTLGFRGEALASIAAVAKVTLKTRMAGADMGTLVRIEGGECVAKKPIACPDGTTFEVQDLFFNTPARLKFLKSARTETAYIAEYIAQMIMARPDISFKYINQGKEIYYSDGIGNLKNAICCVYGTGILPHLLDVDYDDGYVKFWGVIGTAQIARPNRTQQSFFVNGRYIRSPLLSNALQRAYDTRLMSGRFPFAVLAMRIASNELDVNVHPNKTQVRFLNESRLANTLTDVCKKALYALASPELIWPDKRLAGKVQTPPKEVQNSVRSVPQVKSTFTSPGTSDTLYQNRNHVLGMEQKTEKSESKPITLHADKKQETTASNWTKAYPKVPVELEGTKANQLIQQNQSKSGVVRVSEHIPGTAPHLIHYRVEGKRNAAELQPPKQETFLQKNNFHIVGQVFAAYWIVQQGNDVFFIDQHAAHERKLYEEFVNRQKQQETLSQLCLVPYVLKLDPLQFSLAQENAFTLESLGFGLKFLADENQVQIFAAPYLIGETKAESYFFDALDILRKKGEIDSTELVKEELIQASCKHAVKAGSLMNAEEIQGLLDAYVQQGIPLTCPHGRPVMIHMSKGDMEKLFKRTV